MAQIFQFPDVEQALEEPNGLLAMGGALDVTTLVAAYSRGIFPWFNDDQPLLWWSPDPRAVIYPDCLNISRSLQRRLRNCGWQVSVNTAFEQVIRACAEPRSSDDDEGTWIHEEMVDAYVALHRAGYAHSIEVWEGGQGEQLIGGLYGVGINGVLSGESMFHRRTDASKVSVAVTCQHLLDIGWSLLDCQIPNSHLTSLGATLIPRDQFIATLCRDSCKDSYKDSSNGDTFDDGPPPSPSADQWRQLRRANAADYAPTRAVP